MKNLSKFPGTDVMIRKLLKSVAFTLGLLILLVMSVLAVAYWNRDALLSKVTRELNNNIEGKLEVRSINFTFLHDFPNFSLSLEDVTLHDNRFDKPGQEILSAEKVIVDVEFYPLLRKELIISSIELEDADILLFRTVGGETNSDILKKKSDTVRTSIRNPNTTTTLSVDQIDFTNVSMVYVDSTRKKLMRFNFVKTENSLVESDSGFDINMSGKIHFDSLYFNPNSGSYLRNQDASVNLYTHLNTRTKTLEIFPTSNVLFQKNNISLSGNFHIIKGGAFTLQFNTINADPNKLQALLNKKLQTTLSKFTFAGLTTLSALLNGKSIPGNVPDVDLMFSTTKANLHYGSLDFSSVALDGSFTNHVDSLKARDNSNSKIIVSTFKGRMEKIPVEGSISFTKLADPVIDLTFVSKLSFKDVNAHLDNDRFVLDKGNFTSRVAYKGKLSEYLDPTRTRYNGKLNGSIVATDGALYYKPKKIQFNKVQFNGTFTENVFEIKNLALELNGSPIALNGTVKDFIPFFIQPQNKAVVDLTVRSPNLDLTPLTTPREAKRKSKSQNEKNRKRMTELLDLVYDRLVFDIDLKVKELIFRKFKAHNINGRVKMNNQRLEANPISMDLAGGSMRLNFSMDNVFDRITPMAMTARINNADIKELFLNFNHFHQKTIHADNLRGKISADVKFNANVDDTYNLITPSMRGTLNCKIVDGGIVNFEPMENMSNFLLKKRDFSDVEFAELNSKFSIAGTDMDISRMEIQSTVLSFFVEGRYSFTDSTSLSVQIPLSNLKKRDKNFKPKNIGTHAKAGPSVFLHVYRDKDINSKIKIDYDPFKKWTKN